MLFRLEKHYYDQLVGDDQKIDRSGRHICFQRNIIINR